MPANTALSDGAEDVWLAGPLAELLIEHKVEPLHPLDDSECVKLKGIDTVREGLAERLGLSTGTQWHCKLIALYCYDTQQKS